MKRKGQVLIISLWILAILAVLIVGIGHRVSLALRLSRYQKERIKSLYIAKAALNIAISVIEKDEDEFTKDTAVTGEEGKVNINTAAEELLVELLDKAGSVNSWELANNIRAWRGDIGLTIPDYQFLGYVNKGKKFSNIEELMIVKGINADIYNSLKGLITAYPQEGDFKININSAPRVVLEILMNTYVKKLRERNIPVDDPAGLLEAIIDFRENGGKFSDINIESSFGKLSNEQKNILNDPVDGLKNKICIKSDHFRIICEGNIAASKIKRMIDCVYNRQNHKIIYWHEI